MLQHRRFFFHLLLLQFSFFILQALAQVNKKECISTVVCNRVMHQKPPVKGTGTHQRPNTTCSYVFFISCCFVAFLIFMLACPVSIRFVASNTMSTYTRNVIPTPTVFSALDAHKRATINQHGHRTEERNRLEKFVTFMSVLAYSTQQQQQRQPKCNNNNNGSKQCLTARKP